MKRTRGMMLKQSIHHLSKNHDPHPKAQIARAAIKVSAIAKIALIINKDLLVFVCPLFFLPATLFSVNAAVFRLF